jgi:hypothetical protein
MIDFSRRKWVTPLPPFPLRTWMMASSTSMEFFQARSEHNEPINTI